MRIIFKLSNLKWALCIGCTQNEYDDDDKINGFNLRTIN